MSGRRKRKGFRPFRALMSLLCAGIFCLLGLMGYVLIREKGVSAEVPTDTVYDAIIVLGAQVRPDGTPSVQLAWRLDKAAEAWRTRNVPVVVCGAQGADEPGPEAEYMKAYLMEKGVPENRILMDPDSANTRQNLVNAKKLLADRPEIRKVLIVSSDYHVPRAMALAGDLGFDAVGLGSPCRPEYWLKNHGREALAWVKYWLQKYLGLGV